MFINEYHHNSGDSDLNIYVLWLQKMETNDLMSRQPILEDNYELEVATWNGNAILNAMWENKLHADMCITVHGSNFLCHRGVVASASAALSRLVSSAQQDAAIKRFTYPHVEAAVMEQILRYVYTGKLTLTQQNWRQLIRLAHDLQMESVVKEVCIVLARSVRMENALELWRIATGWTSEELARKAKESLAQNFRHIDHSDIYKDQWIELTREELCYLLKSDELNASNESTVLRAVFQWLEKDPSSRCVDFYDVLRYVRLQFVSLEALNMALNHSVIFLLPACKQLLQQTENAIRNREVVPSDLSSNPRQSYRTDRMIMFTDSVPCMQTADWDGVVTTHGRVFENIHSVPWRHENFSKAACSAGFDIFVSGVGPHARQVWWLNCLTPHIHWVQLTPVPAGRRLHNMEVVGDSLYLLGGYQVGNMTPVSDIWQLSLNSGNEWALRRQGLKFAVMRAASVVYGSNIFVIGGEDINNRGTYVQVYNTERGTCDTNHPPVPARIHDATALLHGSTIFVLADNVFYMYQVNLKRWVVTNIGLELMYFGGIVHDEYIYVVGGCTQRGPSDSIYVITIDDARNRRRNWRLLNHIENAKRVFAIVDVGHDTLSHYM